MPKVIIARFRAGAKIIIAPLELLIYWALDYFLKKELFFDKICT